MKSATTIFYLFLDKGRRQGKKLNYSYSETYKDLRLFKKTNNEVVFLMFDGSKFHNLGPLTFNCFIP